MKTGTYLNLDRLCYRAQLSHEGRRHYVGLFLSRPLADAAYHYATWLIECGIEPHKAALDARTLLKKKETVLLGL